MQDLGFLPIPGQLIEVIGKSVFAAKNWSADTKFLTLALKPHFGLAIARIKKDFRLNKIKLSHKKVKETSLPEEGQEPCLSSE